MGRAGPLERVVCAADGRPVDGPAGPRGDIVEGRGVLQEVCFCEEARVGGVAEEAVGGLGCVVGAERC